MPPEPLILAFDTSAAHCAAALLLGEQLLAMRIEPMEKGQAERLMPLLEELLSTAGFGWHDLSALAVGVGPGNFTGVRISVAAARGLALSLEIPAVGVTTLEAMALGQPMPVLCSMDARRGQAYVQIFPDGRAALTNLNDPIEPPPVAGLRCVGDFAPQYANRYHGIAVEPATPMIEAMARIAAARWQSKVPRPTPFYLRGADAAPSNDPGPVILPDVPR